MDRSAAGRREGRRCVDHDPGRAPVPRRRRRRGRGERGHGRREVIEAVAAQLERTQYVHGTMFTTEAVERYADEVAPVLPMDDASSVSRVGRERGRGDRAQAGARLSPGERRASRFTVIGRRSAYHGNTLGALDASGKEPLRKPYTPWLGRFLHAPAAYEYRCENPQPPRGCGAWHAGELERMIGQAPPKSIAAFIAEPVAGATLGAAVPVRGLLASWSRSADGTASW